MQRKDLQARAHALLKIKGKVLVLYRRNPEKP